MECKNKDITDDLDKAIMDQLELGTKYQILKKKYYKLKQKLDNGVINLINSDDEDDDI